VFSAVAIPKPARSCTAPRDHLALLQLKPQGVNELPAHRLGQHLISGIEALSFDDGKRELTGVERAIE
jgi:hypothetical protein